MRPARDANLQCIKAVLNVNDTLLSTVANFLWVSAGLLLNNLSVYHGCEIVFDSSEVPDQAVLVATDVPDVQVSIKAADHANAYIVTLSFSF